MQCELIVNYILKLTFFIRFYKYYIIQKGECGSKARKKTMKKKIILLFSALLFSAVFLDAAVTIRYYNKDSNTHVMKVKISGSSKTVEFGSSRTSTVTIQGGDNTCVIETTCGNVTVKDGANIEIKNGCIKVN